LDLSVQTNGPDRLTNEVQDQNSIPDNSIIAEIALVLQALQLKCNLEVIFYNKFCEV